MTTEQLIEQLTVEGGGIVSSSACTAIEIAWAQKEGRYSVDNRGRGFVRRPEEWLDRTPNPFPDMADAEVGAAEREHGNA